MGQLSSQRKRRRAVLLRYVGAGLLGGAALACSAPSSEEVRAVSEPIVHGTPSDVSQNAVVLLFDASAGFVCSATLVAPNLVLTARHCVSNITTDALNCDTNGNAVSGGQVGSDYLASNLAVYVGNTRKSPFPRPTAHATRIFHDDSKNLCNHDLALLELDTAITSVPPATLRIDSGVVAQEVVTVVGWGVTDAVLVPTQRQARTGVAVLAVGPTIYNTVPVPPADFFLGESICDGDSGAPAFSATTGAVLGVASYGGNGSTYDATKPALSCEDLGSGIFNAFTSLAPFKAVILNAFAASGSQPIVEAPPTLPGSMPSGCAVVSGATSTTGAFVGMGIALALAFSCRRRRS